jgi:hypothetical protein
MTDLELAVSARLSETSKGHRETMALKRLRTQLRTWRSDRSLSCETRAIIVIERSRARRAG